MSDVTKVGELIAPGSQRDAIHIAVAPVVATERLEPGQTIGFANDDMRSVEACELAMSVGIVDPFLRKTVQEGEHFWMFLHPNTITSLRHNWTHPAFGGQEDVILSKAKSEGWLRNFINNSDCPDYETVIAEAVHSDGSNYLHISGSDASGEIPPEFWDHVEVVTGYKIKSRPTHFSCSC